jgi:hypothetical protein
MKKVGVWNYYELINNTKNPLYAFESLETLSHDYGFELGTVNADNFDEFDCYLFQDFPNLKNNFINKILNNNKPKFLIIMEAPGTKSNNWDKKNHLFFEKIFTWDDGLVDDLTYFKINFPQNFNPYLDVRSLAKDNKIVNISSNIKKSFNGELYSLRLDIINWFEIHYPDKFDLYGRSWNKFSIDGSFLSALNKIKALHIFSKKYSTYKGEINGFGVSYDEKIKVLGRYKFSLCLENQEGLKGYITEKIFDCFCARTIPIYKGCSNIDSHIPKGCYIDLDNFNDLEDLYAYVDAMPENLYLEYINSINIFLKSDDIHKFSNDYFAQTILINL